MIQTTEDLCRKLQSLDNEWNKKNHDVEDCLKKVEEITVSGVPLFDSISLD